MKERPGWWSSDPPQRPVLFVNPRSGGGKAARAQVAERARERGIETVIFAPGQSLETLARGAVTNGADALGVAGGDGSLAVVAAAAAAHGLPFVCVPAGTRNHFALDLGVDPHDVIGALDAFTDGIERRIDVAEVNGRVFVNNVSLGIYGDAVRSPAYRDAKVRTLLETAKRVLGPSAEVPACGWLTTWGASTVVLPSCSYRTTPTRWIARSPGAPVRRLRAVGSGSLFSMHRARAPTLQGVRGARHVWRWVQRRRCTPELMARRWI